MEVIEQLKVSKEQFFYQLLYSVQMEIENTTNSKISIKDIKKGYSYQKKMTTKVNTSGVVKVIIDDVIENEVYRMRVVTSRGDTITEYRIQEIEPNKIKVTYREEFISSSKYATWNYKLMSYPYVKRGKKKISAMLQAIEAYILESEKKVP